MEKIDLKDRKVTVMGIGLHGGAVDMIKWLLGQGARVTATDMKSREELAPSLEKLKGLKNLTVVTGQHRMEDFQHAQMVIKNPAVRWDNKYVQAALDKKVPVEMDASLFFKMCPSKKIIGITGTKGKTTTSTLIYEILKAAGKKVIKVGIGQEPVMNKLAEIDKETWVVFELSSWRLSALGRVGLSPHIALVTNIYPDHLNYYQSMAEYIKDKKYLFVNQTKNDWVVLNGDNEETAKMIAEAKGKVVLFGRIDNQADAVYEKDGQIIYRLGDSFSVLCQTGELSLKGEHNLYNFMAAIAAGLVVGVSGENIVKVIKQFKGNPHRQELVREIKNIKFINDTAATTPEAGIAGIKAFSEQINLICGGSNKNLDLNGFAQQIAESEHIKNVFLLQGAATDGLHQLIAKFSGAEKVCGIYSSMDEAVKAAYQVAIDMSRSNPTEKQIVLLTPGCASFGMFQNEFDRGDKFKNAVEGLK